MRKTTLILEAKVLDSINSALLLVNVRQGEQSIISWSLNNDEELTVTRQMQPEPKVNTSELFCFVLLLFHKEIKRF